MTPFSADWPLGKQRRCLELLHGGPKGRRTPIRIPKLAHIPTPTLMRPWPHRVPSSSPSTNQDTLHPKRCTLADARPLADALHAIVHTGEVLEDALVLELASLVLKDEEPDVDGQLPIVGEQGLDGVEGVAIRAHTGTYPPTNLHTHAQGRADACKTLPTPRLP